MKWRFQLAFSTLDLKLTRSQVDLVRPLVAHTNSYTGDWLTNYLRRPVTSKSQISSELSTARWYSRNELGDEKAIDLNLKEYTLNKLDGIQLLRRREKKSNSVH